MQESAIKNRITQLLSLQFSGGDYASSVVTAQELLQGAVTLLTAVHGPDSTQVTTLRDFASEALSRREGTRVARGPYDVILTCRGALQNLKNEIEEGLVGSLRLRMTADALTDLVQLSRLVLEDTADASKDVAAVLGAAAFEATIRKMAENLAGVSTRDTLQELITILKGKGILQPPQLGIAQSYLSFRNHALHAQWDRIDRASVQSVIAFVEQLLIKHFS